MTNIRAYFKADRLAHLVLLAMMVLIANFGFASITSTSGNIIYVDSSSNVTPNLLGNYVVLKVTNDTGSAINDAWVKLDSFTGSYVSLAVNENGIVHLGPMTSGQVRTVFVYLNVNCSSFAAGNCNVATAQPFTSRLFNGSPSTGTQLQSQALSLTVQETTAAQANKVTTVVTSTNDPILGSLVTVTVTGNTGTIGSAKTFYASPETYYDFPANVFKLYSTTVTFTGANTGTYVDQLLVPTSAFSSTSATDYTFSATYLVRGITSLTTAISPVAFISSGTQIKHTDTSGYASLSPIPPSNNSITLSQSVNTTSFANGGVATYTIRATNSGSANVVLDDFIDTLPTSPAAASYVASSSKLGGSAIADPTISGNQLTWSGPYVVPANGTLDLSYSVNIPSSNGIYTNRAVGHVGSTQVDTTISTSDDSPAIAMVGVGSPDLVMTSTHVGNFTQGQTSATYTLTVSNTGALATFNPVVATDVLPASLTLTSLSGSGWTCDVLTASCTRADSLPALSSYPPITATVSVGSSAPASVTNTVSVSTLGEANIANNTSSDITTIIQVPILNVTSTHVGDFIQGQQGASYTISVSNVGMGSTSGAVTVTDSLPAGLTVQSESGTGWSCTTSPILCTRTDVLGPNSTYPVITIVFDVARNATSPLTNTVSVSGGQSASSSSNDSTVIDPYVRYAPNTTLTISPSTTIPLGSAATLSASVTYNGNPVTPGVVDFCDATAPSCTGLAHLGVAQLDANGNASITLSLPAGTYTVEAQFAGNKDAMKSTSSSQQFSVTSAAGYASITKLTSSGAPGNYTFTANVAAIGAPGLAGKITFSDAAAGTLGEVTLDPASSGYATKMAAPVGSTDGVDAELLADFDNDGVLDLVTANASSTISVRIGNGDGSFQPNNDYPVNANAAAFVVGDFNADGNLDLAVVTVDSSKASSVHVMLGNGDGSFQAGVDYSAGLNTKSIATADVNGDGDSDVIVINSDDNSIGVLLGNGDGTFQPQMTFATGSAPQSLAIVDVNGDGYPDVLTANSSDNTVAVLLGNGDGTFQPATTYVTGTTPTTMSVADLNGDGIADIATAQSGENTIDILLGNSDGTFQPKLEIALSSTANTLNAADFNGDSKLDLVYTNAAAGTATVLLAKGDGSFDVKDAASTLVSPSVAVSGDLNNDGLADVVAASNIANNNISVLLSQHTQQASISGVALDPTLHNVTAIYSGDSYRAGSADGVSVGTAVSATTTTLTVNPTAVVVGATVALKATVSPAVNGGTVNFYADGVLLGTAQCDANGIATLVTSSLTVGAHNITAVFAGDILNATSTSSEVDVTVTNPAKYTVQASQTPFNVNAGGSVDIDVTVPPVGGSFSNEVTLSASGVPAGYVISFTPAKVIPGANGAHTTMTVKTSSQFASIHRGSMGSMLGMLGVAFGICFRARKRKLTKNAIALVLSLLAFSTIGMTGCGGGFAGKRATPAPVAPQTVSHVITITGTSGNLQASTTVTIMVTK